MNATEKNRNFRQWAILPGDRYRSCAQTVDRLPPGAYNCVSDMEGESYLVQRDLELDALIDFPGSLPAKILAEIEKFWQIGHRFKKYGLLHRRGYLLHGKQGCGKSSVIHLLVARIVAAGNVAFFCEDSFAFFRAVEQFRAVEPDRPALCIFEDIDGMVSHGRAEGLLQWLDGNLQVDKVVNIATTNYLEKLEQRIRARPRRFDRVLRIDQPDRQLRSAYFERKLPDQTFDERERWVDVSEGLSFAALAELIISVCCLDKDLEESAKLLAKLDRDDTAEDDSSGDSSEVDDSSIYDAEESTYDEEQRAASNGRAALDPIPF